MLKSLSTALILRGIVAVALGIIALVWPGVTVLTLVVLFAVSAFIASGVQAMLAVNSTGGGRVAGHLLLGLADLAAGVIALAWPGPTALVLVLIVGCWAVFAGLFGIFVAFRADELARSRALFILSGLGAVAFGVSLFARPAMGAVALALLFGLFSLTNGAGLIMQGIGLRQNQKTRPSAVRYRNAA
jgi:uncharacterized membrane protein HdeD (DUF308 family)